MSKSLAIVKKMIINNYGDKESHLYILIYNTMNTKTSTQKIGKYIYTLIIDYDKLVAKIYRPAKSRLGIKYVLNGRYNNKDYMDKQIINCIERLNSWDQFYTNKKEEKKAAAIINKDSKHLTPAQAIKKDLKKMFPDISFSCRYTTYSMGSSVDVSWTDGPTELEVNKIIKKYQYGSFDGMTDMYEYTNSRDDIPQAKYIHTRRIMSANTRENIQKGIDLINNNTFYNNNRDQVYVLFNKYSIPKGHTVLGIKSNGVSCGINSIEEFYCLDISE